MQLESFCRRIGRHVVTSRPRDPQSRWFGYVLHLELGESGLARIRAKRAEREKPETSEGERKGEERGEVEGSELETSKASEVTDLTDDTLLHDATRSPVESALHRFAQDVSSIEPLSHVLFWGNDDEIQLVEMPRLQIRFRFRMGPVFESGSAMLSFKRKFYCEAYGGWLWAGHGCDGGCRTCRLWRMAFLPSDFKLTCFKDEDRAIEVDVSECVRMCKTRSNVFGSLWP